jgi:hypothetical protein
MTPANSAAGPGARALLCALAAVLSDHDIAALRGEAGFQDPNDFDFELLVHPLSTLEFPPEDACYEVMWALHECGLLALERYPAPVRQYLAAIYLHCNRLRTWGLNLEADYHYMLVSATLEAGSTVAAVMAFLDSLADSTGAVEGFDPRMAQFSWLLLHCAFVATDTEASVAKRQLLGAPMLADLRADLLVVQRSLGDWEQLHAKACEMGRRGYEEFTKLFFGSAEAMPPR